MKNNIERQNNTTFTVKGKNGRDCLIFKKTSANWLITAIVDDCGADYVIPLELLK